jgi:hypothetical protein
LATLVLSTVGTALGGPVGSAIGALIGQSIDQELLAPARRGPRVGDLAVQTSSYGTQIPRIYGTMRVAGSVIWATDLIEHEQVGGAKGEPDVTYGYTVSLAVALSSRPIAGIKRIWADGQLLRGQAGDLKVRGTLRVWNGTEDQALDPLIASTEGIGSTPAYRGLALAVFEDLELGSFGNRIPFLTFEVEGADGTPTASSILADASAGVIYAGADQLLHGYAAYGRSIRSVAEPLVETFGIDLFDDGEVLRSRRAGAAIDISEMELGNSADTGTVPRIEREQAAAGSLPTSLRLAFYDPARDYQAGEARASAADETAGEAQQELSAALTATEAKSMAQRMLARAWSSRDRLTLRLPPARMAIEPGDVLRLPLSPAVWTVDKVTLDGFVPIVELRPAAGAQALVAADSGRIVPNVDAVAGTPVLGLFDIPALPGSVSDQPMILLAATHAATGWRARAAEVSFSGQSIFTQTARSKSVLGHATTVLGPGTAHLIDEINSVDVELTDRDQWLTSCDDEALAGGENLAVVGSEVFQFGRAVLLSEGKFRLSHLLRGRGGTEWASAGHAIGEHFCLLRPGTLRPIPLPSWSIGGQINVTTAGSSASSILLGKSVRPMSPVNLSAEMGQAGEAVLRWRRRSRPGLAWLDGVDAPLGEADEAYRITLAGSLGTVELQAGQPQLVVDAATLAKVGTRPVTVSVTQIGDMLASHPAELTIFIG